MKIPWNQVKQQANGLVLFFQPVIPKHPSLRNKLMQMALGIASAISLIILSGISLSALAILLTSSLFILLIIENVLGIEIQLPPLA